MPQQIGIELHENVSAKLLEIPSAVTVAERQLTLHYLTSYWDGTGDIFENGTLLGGATRALGMGMMYNEKRDPDSLLWTYDWFSFREDNPLDVPPEAFDYLVSAGFLTSEDLSVARATGTYQPIFGALHDKEDYWPLVRPRTGYLPGHRDEVPAEGEEAVFSLDDNGHEFQIAFVDGCKSWYGTKHWFHEIVPYLRPDTDIMFQDFGHYTCFWIAMLVSTFRERFSPIAYVDRTYIWRLSQPPSRAEVERLFPDEPTDFHRDEYDAAFDWLRQGAEERGDRYAAMIHECHRAAAYAYLGLKDEARDILDKLLMLVEWLPLRDYLKQARISPTYTPEARIEL